MKIALAARHARPLFMPLAPLYLKAYLVAREGWDAADVDVLEFGPASSVDEMVAAISASAPDIVGLSCYVWNVQAFMEAAARLKAGRPGVLIVLGGPEVGPIARSVLQANPAIDVIVRSEGERPFAAIVRQRGAGAPLGAVPGITFRDGDRIVETGDAPILEDLNELASPHLAFATDLAGRIPCIETQRGCVFRCNFCFYNKDLSIRNRRFDLDRVKSEIRWWLERDVKQIYLMDPIFNLYADRAKEICRFIIEHNTRRIPFQAEIWAEFVDPELAALMRDVPFTFLEVGLQTTDTNTLATVERRLKMQKFLDGVRALTDHGLPWELQLIFGLPGETMETFRRSLNFAASLEPPDLAVFPLMVLPGTELWRKADGLRLEFDPEPPYYVRSHFSMTADEIAHGFRLVELFRNVRHLRTFKLLGREQGLTYADVIDGWTRWHDRLSEPWPAHGFRAKQFLVDFCAERGIPDGFYRAFASWEVSG